MRIWVILVLLYNHFPVYVGGQLQTSFWGSNGQQQKQQNDNHNQLSASTFRHEFDKSNQSFLSLTLNDENTTRRLGTTQVNYVHYFLSRLFFDNSPISICCDDYLNEYRISSRPSQARG